MVLLYINMNPHKYTRVLHPEPPSLLPHRTILLGCLSAPAPSIQYHALKLTSGLPVFPAPLVKEIVFSPLYILDSFVKDKVSISVWIYLWAFYFVPLIYISVFVPVQYCLDGCGFVVESEIRQVDSSNSILLSQDCLAI